MTKIFCDRCGKEITEPKKGAIHHRVYYGRVWMESFRYVNDEELAIHTICETCEDDFIKWFNAGRRK